MTTIVATRKAIYADKKVTGGPSFNGCKVFECGSSIIGCCGKMNEFMRYIDWRRGNADRPTFEGADFQMIELTKEGQLFLVDEEMVAIEILEDFYAIGSGGLAALGALAAGASPTRAIQIASLYDEKTGREVQVIKKK